MIAVVAAVALLAAYISRDSNRSVEMLYQQRLVPLEHLKNLADLYTGVVFKANQIALGRGDSEQTRKDVLEATASIQRHWKELSNSTTESKDVEALAAATKTAQSAEPALKELLDALAAKDRLRASLVAVDLGDAANAIGKHIIILQQIQIDHSHTEFLQADTRFQTGIQTFGAVVAVVILSTIATTWILIRGITQPIHQAVAIAKRVSTGDMSETISYEGNSEMAEMLKALHDMQTSLGRVVENVRNSAHGLESASSEIAQGNQDLSGRTESQASALEQTAASMEELSSQVQHNAESARQANQLALSATTVAVSGGEVMERVVVTMRNISDASRKIADIIGVIDGIAFQTNILALNAAVEAARAGEQGRGFAVVASEVRSLAGRSASAAREIRTLIQASVETVEQGMLQVNQAGTTMGEVVGSIRRVTDLMSEINAASAEQSAGVSQVGEAVTQMDQATQQNAALVEQIAAAAASLKSQASDLVQVVAVFKLGRSPLYLA